MADPDPVRRAEATGHAAWPALREMHMDGWLLRFAGGHKKRANSIDVVGSAEGDPTRKIAACEALCRAKGLPTVFRLSTAALEPGLDEALDRAGCGPPFHPSAVLHADLAGTPSEPAVGAFLIEGKRDRRWLAASAALAGLDAPAARLRDRMVDALSAPAAFAAVEVEVEGAIASRAPGAVCGGLVCLNTVATAPEYRGRGLARRAVAAVLGWAMGRHGGACLQAQVDNRAALTPYRGFGFGTELSHYRHRDDFPRAGEPTASNGPSRVAAGPGS